MIINESRLSAVK